MGFLKDAHELNAIPYRKREWVQRQLGDDRDEFEAALADPTIQPIAVWRALTTRGITLPYRTVYEWCHQARRF